VSTGKKTAKGKEGVISGEQQSQYHIPLILHYRNAKKKLLIEIN